MNQFILKNYFILFKKTNKNKLYNQSMIIK